MLAGAIVVAGGWFGIVRNGVDSIYLAQKWRAVSILCLAPEALVCFLPFFSLVAWEAAFRLGERNS
jgi:hypothetical protein